MLRFTSRFFRRNSLDASRGLASRKKTAPTAASVATVDANSVVRLNAGGRRFETSLRTLQMIPNSPLAHLASRFVAQRKRNGNVKNGISRSGNEGEIFLDVDGDAFNGVLLYLRRLATADRAANDADVSWQTVYNQAGPSLRGPTQHIIETLCVDASQDGNEAASTSSSSPQDSEQQSAAKTPPLPETIVVQLCDHMQHDQGVKKHAMTITYGADGFGVRSLVKSCRKDLKTLLSATYWQAYQTNERSAFFITTKMGNASADLLLTSVSQSVIAHTEGLGFQLASSYVTLSPDTTHLSVRVFMHYLIFRRVDSNVQGNRLQNKEEGAIDDDDDDDGHDGRLHSNSAGTEVGEYHHALGPRQPPAAVGSAGGHIKQIWD